MNQRRCNYLVVTALPASLRWCASAVAAAATTAAAAAASVSVAIAAATVQRRCTTGQGGGTVLRPCLQHCKAAPQPRETGQKKRKCRGRSDGARDETRGASEIPSAGWERTAQSVRDGDAAKEEERAREGEREEACIRTRHTAIVGRSGMRKSPTLAAFFSRCVT